MCNGKAPSPPDTEELLNLATDFNQTIADYQTNLNRVNQVGPNGSLQYSQTTDADGNPVWTATTTLSPEMQSIRDQTLTGANALASRIAEGAGSPLDWSAQQTYLNDLTAKNLDPVWDRNREQFEQRMLDRGISTGSQAYTDASRDFEGSQSSAYNSANLSNFNNAIQSQLALRSQPINELSALLNGTSLTTPQFGSTPQTGVGGVDAAGIAQQGYANEYGAWADQRNATNQMLGGLFGAGANLLMLSDDDAKKDKEKVGETDGLGVWSYHYKGEPETAPKRLGLMASEVEDKMPEAVTRGADGMRRVDYGMALGVAQ